MWMHGSSVHRACSPPHPCSRTAPPGCSGPPLSAPHGCCGCCWWWWQQWWWWRGLRCEGCFQALFEASVNGRCSQDVGGVERVRLVGEWAQGMHGAGSGAKGWQRQKRRGANGGSEDWGMCEQLGWCAGCMGVRDDARHVLGCLLW
jgi:hypothetical protein